MLEWNLEFEIWTLDFEIGLGVSELALKLALEMDALALFDSLLPILKSTSRMSRLGNGNKTLHSLDHHRSNFANIVCFVGKILVSI